MTGSSSAAGETTGVTPELLEGTDEARLSMAGAVSDLDPERGPFLILDIGGGSTELVAGSGPDDPALAAVSMQIGCVRLTERFLTSDPPSPDELGRAESMVTELLDATIADQPRLGSARQLVGLAGTITTLASLQMGLDDYDPERIHHSVLTFDEAHLWYLTLAGEVRRARLDRAGMVEGREDVIVGGALILDRVMHRFGFDRMPGLGGGHPRRHGGRPAQGVTGARRPPGGLRRRARLRGPRPVAGPGSA